jgi:hypothetical protein
MTNTQDSTEREDTALLEFAQNNLFSRFVVLLSNWMPAVEFPSLTLPPACRQFCENVLYVAI